MPLIIGRNLEGSNLETSVDLGSPEPVPVEDLNNHIQFLVFFDEPIVNGPIDIDIQLITLNLPSQSQVVGNELCLKELQVFEVHSYQPPDWILSRYRVRGYDPAPFTARSQQRTTTIFKDLCAGTEPLTINSSSEIQEMILSQNADEPNQLIGAGVVEPSFYFPFDRHIVDVGFLLFIEGKDNEPTPIQPIINANIISHEWDKVASFHRDKPEWLDIPASIVTIELQRPLGIRVLTILLLVSTTLFIAALYYVEETGTFMEVAIGILLGLWGLQDVLIPSDLEGQTMIGAIILGLYAWLAFVSFLRFLVKPAFKKLSRQEEQLLTESREINETGIPNTSKRKTRKNRRFNLVNFRNFVFRRGRKKARGKSSRKQK